MTRSGLGTQVYKGTYDFGNYRLDLSRKYLGDFDLDHVTPRSQRGASMSTRLLGGSCYDADATLGDVTQTWPVPLTDMSPDICPCRAGDGDNGQPWAGYSDEGFTAITGKLHPSRWQTDADVTALLYHLLRCRVWVDATAASRLWGCSTEAAGEKLAEISHMVKEWSGGRARIVLPVPSTEGTPYPAYSATRVLRMVSPLARDPVVAMQVERKLPRRALRSDLALEWAEHWGSISPREAAIAAYCDQKAAAKLLRELAPDRGWERVVTGPGQRVRYFLPGHSGPLSASRYDTDGRADQATAVDHILGTSRPLRSNTAGECRLCDRSFTRLGIANHITSCRRRTVSREWDRQVAADGNDDLARAYHLEIWSADDPDFWMHVEIPAALTLETLDRFIRRKWMEDCGHPSRFIVNGEKYDSHVPDEKTHGFSYPFPVNPMTVPLSDVAGITDEPFRYEYDFGSTSTARIKAVSSGWSKQSDIRLVARNDLAFYSCEICGENASTIRIRDYEQDDDGEDRSELLCDPYKHPLGQVPKNPATGEDEISLWTIPNSSRWGICGHTVGKLLVP